MRRQARGDELRGGNALLFGHAPRSHRHVGDRHGFERVQQFLRLPLHEEVMQVLGERGLETGVAVHERLPVVRRAQHVVRVRLVEGVGHLPQAARHRRLLEEPREGIRIRLSAMERQRRHAVFKKKGARETRRDAESEGLGPPLRPGADERCRRDALQRFQVNLRGG